MPNLIVAATVTNVHNGQSYVTAEFADGRMEDVVHFYCDEIGFSREEFIGLTREGAVKVHMEKDTAFLQS